MIETMQNLIDYKILQISLNIHNGGMNIDGLKIFKQSYLSWLILIKFVICEVLCIETFLS